MCRMTTSAVNNMLIENCKFIRSGQSAAKCSLDAEDGWDMIQDVILKNNSFINNMVNIIIFFIYILYN